MWIRAGYGYGCQEAYVGGGVWPWFGTQERVAIKANANAGAKNHECWYQEVVVIT